MKLSLRQKQIVENINGPLLDKARPGTGKTRVLTGRLKNWLSAKKTDRFISELLPLISKKYFLVPPDYCSLNEPFSAIYNICNNFYCFNNTTNFDDILFFK